MISSHAVPVGYRAHQAIDLILNGRIAAKSSAINAAFAHLCGDLLAQLLTPAGDDNRGTQFAEGGSHCTAKVRASTGYYPNTPSQVEKLLHSHGRQ